MVTAADGFDTWGTLCELPLETVFMNQLYDFK
jgi:hypothetical protein